MVCAALANLLGDRKEHPEPYAPDDFMPRTAEPQSDESMADMGRMWTLALGGEVKKDGG